jgi:hypothetical protein
LHRPHSRLVADYPRLRQVPEWFIVRDGHEQLDIERVVEEERDYLIVEKIGDAARVAQAGQPEAA